MATQGFTYDHDTAVHFIATRTGLPETVVSTILIARDRHQLGLGIWKPTEPDEIEEQRVLRATYPVYFPPHHIAKRYEDTGLQYAFIVETTGEESGIVESAMAADLEYMMKIGIISTVNSEI
jgi:hypothetical protein